MMDVGFCMNAGVRQMRWIKQCEHFGKGKGWVLSIKNIFAVRTFYIRRGNDCRGLSAGKPISVFRICNKCYLALGCILYPCHPAYNCIPIPLNPSSNKFCQFLQCSFYIICSHFLFYCNPHPDYGGYYIRRSDLICPNLCRHIYGLLLLFLFLLLVICVIELDYLFCQVCLLRAVDYAGLCLKYECIALFLCQLFCNLQQVFYYYGLFFLLPFFKVIIGLHVKPLELLHPGLNFPLLLLFHLITPHRPFLFCLLIEFLELFLPCVHLFLPLLDLVFKLCNSLFSCLTFIQCLLQIYNTKL